MLKVRFMIKNQRYTQEMRKMSQLFCSEESKNIQFVTININD